MKKIKAVLDCNCWLYLSFITGIILGKLMRNNIKDVNSYTGTNPQFYPLDNHHWDLLAITETQKLDAYSNFFYLDVLWAPSLLLFLGSFIRKIDPKISSIAALFLMIIIGITYGLDMYENITYLNEMKGIKIAVLDLVIKSKKAGYALIFLFVLLKLLKRI